MYDVVASHVNTEGERITIERMVGGEFDGQFLLVIHDDAPSPHFAPMLLDEGTRDWLRTALDLSPTGSTVSEADRGR